MRFEASEKCRKALTGEQGKSLDNILGLISDMAATGHLVVKDDRGRQVPMGPNDEQTDGVDNTGREPELENR